MSQTLPPTLSGFLPLVNIGGIPCALIPTVHTVTYSGGTTLAEALASMNEQIVASAATVARQDADLADAIAFLIERFDYQPSEHATGNTYLTPLFTELEKVPSDSAPESQRPVPATEGGIA